MALLVCKESFTRWRNGIPSSVAAGEVIDDKDWRIKGKSRDGTPLAELWCEPAESTVERQRVEQATSAPGEKRAAVKPKAAAKAED